MAKLCGSTQMVAGEGPHLLAMIASALELGSSSLESTLLIVKSGANSSESHVWMHVFFSSCVELVPIALIFENIDFDVVASDNSL